MIRRSSKSKATKFFIDAAVHPQVLAVMRTRAKWLGIELVVGDAERDLQHEKVFGCHVQYPDTYGRIRDFSQGCRKSMLLKAWCRSARTCSR